MVTCVVLEQSVIMAKVWTNVLIFCFRAQVSYNCSIYFFFIFYKTFYWSITYIYKSTHIINVQHSEYHKLNTPVPPAPRSRNRTLSIPRNPYHALLVAGFPSPSARELLYQLVTELTSFSRCYTLHKWNHVIRTFVPGFHAHLYLATFVWESHPQCCVWLCATPSCHFVMDK